MADTPGTTSTSGSANSAGSAVNSALRMPPKADLVAESIARFDVLGLRSQLLSLDDRTLQDLGLRLTDRETSVLQACHWLNQELGGTPENPGVDKNAVYRFAEHFRRVYLQVRAEYAKRIARLSVADATAGQVSQAAQVAQARLIDLVAQRLVESDTLEDLSGGELAGTIATLTAWGNAQLKRQELELRAADGERKAAKLEADLAKLRLDIQERERRLAEAVRQVKAKLDGIPPVGAAPGVVGVTRDQVYELLDRVMKGEE